MAHSATIGLTMVALVGAIAALRVTIRVMGRANRQIEAIFADELRDRPGERGF